MTDSRIAPPVRVLLAIRDADLKKSAAEILARKDFTVELADAAEDAFQKVRVFRPNVTFYDLGLEGYDGFEALTLISKMRSGKEGFLIAVSDRPVDEAGERAAAAGAWDYIRTPCADSIVFDTAAVIKRHLNRPKDRPKKASSGVLKIAFVKCPRSGCESQVTAFALKHEPANVKEDQFETLVYAAAGAGEECLDYNLVCVAVCPECYYAFDYAAAKAHGAEAPEAQPSFPPEPVLFRIAATADDTLFLEERSPAAALAAFRMAVENERTAIADDSPEALGRLADLMFKAAVAAHAAGDERARDKFFAEAERVCSACLRFEPCAAVYRAAYRLVALYTFFMRDLDAARMLKSFDRFERPTGGRMKPRDSRILAAYRTAGADIVANKHYYRRADYLAR